MLTLGERNCSNVYLEMFDTLMSSLTTSSKSSIGPGVLAAQQYNNRTKWRYNVANQTRNTSYTNSHFQMSV